MRRAVVILLLLTTAARAEAPWGIALSAGPAAHRIGTNGEFTLGAGSQLDAAYRVVDRAAFGAGIGVHLGIAFVRVDDYDGDVETSMAFEFGLGAQLVIADRVLIVPWAGYLDLALPRSRAAGIELGVDFLVRGRERMSAVAMFTRAPGNYSASYNAVGAGIAYRYW